MYDLIALLGAMAVEQLQVHRVVDDELQPPVHRAHGQDQVLLDEVLGDEREIDLALGLFLVEVDELHVELGGQRLGDLRLLAEAGLHERLAEALPGPAGQVEPLLDLLVGDGSPLREDLTELLAFPCHAASQGRARRSGAPGLLSS